MSTRTDTEIAPELRAAVTRFVVPLQTTRIVDSAAFERLHALTLELMRSYKGKDLVSKSLLNELYVTSRVIQAESAHAKTERGALEAMANKLETCVGLLLKNEVLEERQSGIPRII